VEQIEYSRIVCQDRTRAVIPQIMIKLGEGFGNVSISATVNNIEALSGMGVEKPQPIFWRSRNRSLGGPETGRKQKSESKRTH
jgi:hypothetical protein